jgi:hypothetical protein
MLGTKLNIPESAAGRRTELISKAGREEKSSDVLMWVSTTTDKRSGEMKAQLRGVGTTSIFQKVRNAFLGRQPASTENVRNLFLQRGMTSEQADTVLDNLTTCRGHYLAESVKQALQTFSDERRAEVQKTGKSPDATTSIFI